MVLWRLFYPGHFCGKGLGYIGNTPALGAGSFQLRSALAWEKYRGLRRVPVTSLSCRFSHRWVLQLPIFSPLFRICHLLTILGNDRLSKIHLNKQVVARTEAGHPWSKQSRLKDKDYLKWEFQLAAKPAAMFLLGRSTACLQLSLSILRDDKGGKILSFHCSHISLHLLNLSNGEWCQILFPQLFICSQSNYLGYFFPTKKVKIFLKLSYLILQKTKWIQCHFPGALTVSFCRNICFLLLLGKHCIWIVKFHLCKKGCISSV